MLPQNQPIPQNQQIPPNQQIPQNQQIPPNQQYQQMQPNQPIPQNQQVPQNQQIPQKPSQRQLPPLPKISGQQSHPMINHYSSQHIPIRQTSSAQSLQSSGSNVQLQATASRLSLGGMSSTQSMQSMESSDVMLSQQPSQDLLPTQTFPIIYNRVTYMVDPNLLMNSSVKFRDLIQPFLNDEQISPDIHLEIVCYDFTNRNMNNFLRLCQNLPTDVQNSEMEEICEIAKMFQADKIYDTGVNFVKNNLDPDFSVPDSKYDGSDGKTWMFVECEGHSVHHADLNNLDFDDIEDEDDENDDSDDNEQKENEGQKENVNVENNEVKNKSSKDVNKDKENEKSGKKGKIKSVIYHVRIENHKIKCPIYRFCLDNKILYTAKQKGNNIYIANGNDVHIKSNQDNHAAHIYQDSAKNNFIFIDHDQYKLSYVDSGKPNQLSVSITFPYKDRKIVWTPKTPKYNAMKDKYYLNFHGEYHHHAIHSKRNMVLQNADGHTTFICRKAADNLFELEALPVINPLIIFSIGLSDIVGPYVDPINF